MYAAMQPDLFRSFKMGYLDCTRATIDFIGEIESTADRKKEIIDHISSECMKTLQNQCPTTNFNQHHEAVFANVNPPENFVPFSLLSAGGDMEWPSLEERLGFSPIGKSNFLLPDVLSTPSPNGKDIKITTSVPFTSTPITIKPTSSLLKIAIPPSTPTKTSTQNSRQSAFVAINKSACIVDTSLESPSTSGTSVTYHSSTDEIMPQQSIFMSDNMSTSDNDHDGDDEAEEDDDAKLIIDDHNNNQAAWRPWL